MHAKPADARILDEHLHQEMIDAIDEEFELELDDGRLARLLERIGHAPQPTLDRHMYFRELLRLQRELIKLQDWVTRAARTLAEYVARRIGSLANDRWRAREWGMMVAALTP